MKNWHWDSGGSHAYRCCGSSERSRPCQYEGGGEVVAAERQALLRVCENDNKNDEEEYCNMVRTIMIVIAIVMVIMIPIMMRLNTCIHAYIHTHIITKISAHRRRYIRRLPGIKLTK